MDMNMTESICGGGEDFSKQKQLAVAAGYLSCNARLACG